MAKAKPESESTPEPKSEEPIDARGHEDVIAERKRRREEATQVDGTESAQSDPSLDPYEAAKARGALGVE